MTTIALASLLSAALICDLKSRRIPNWLTVAGMAVGILCSVILPREVLLFSTTANTSALAIAIEGVFVGILAMLPLYLLRAMGAGDVKLMMAIGSFLGPLQTIGVVLLTFAAGGVLALLMALWQRSFTQLALNLRYMLTTSLVRAAGGDSPRFEPLAQTAGRMPYAVAIAAGTLLQFVLVRSGGWMFS